MEGKITILGKEYTMRHCVRARMMAEAISGSMWTLGTLTGQYVYFYACILAGTKGVEMEFSEFLDIIDKNPALMQEFQEFSIKALKAEESLLKKEPKKGDGSGKN